MNGQWIGNYQGASTGLIVVNVDERRAYYQGVAYVNENDAALPSVAAFFHTQDKSSQFAFRTERFFLFTRLLDYLTLGRELKPTMGEM